jgi:hypothetical protein
MLNKGEEYDLFENEFGVEYIRVKGTYRPIINGKVRMFLDRKSQKYMKQQPKKCHLCEEAGLIPNQKFNDYEIDHIIPLWAGGTDEISNLRWMCMLHNRGRKHGNGKNFYTKGRQFLNEGAGNGLS